MARHVAVWDDEYSVNTHITTCGHNISGLRLHTCRGFVAEAVVLFGCQAF